MPVQLMDQFHTRTWRGLNGENSTSSAAFDIFNLQFSWGQIMFQGPFVKWRDAIESKEPKICLTLIFHKNCFIQHFMCSLFRKILISDFRYILPQCVTKST